MALGRRKRNIIPKEPPAETTPRVRVPKFTAGPSLETRLREIKASLEAERRLKRESDVDVPPEPDEPAVTPNKPKTAETPDYAAMSADEAYNVAEFRKQSVEKTREALRTERERVKADVLAGKLDRGRFVEWDERYQTEFKKLADSEKVIDKELADNFERWVQFRRAESAIDKEVAEEANTFGNKLNRAATAFKDNPSLDAIAPYLLEAGMIGGGAVVENVIKPVDKFIEDIPIIGDAYWVSKKPVEGALETLKFSAAGYGFLWEAGETAFADNIYDTALGKLAETGDPESIGLARNAGLFDRSDWLSTRHVQGAARVVGEATGSQTLGLLAGLAAGFGTDPTSYIGPGISAASALPGAVRGVGQLARVGEAGVRLAGAGTKLAGGAARLVRAEKVAQGLGRGAKKLGKIADDIKPEKVIDATKRASMAFEPSQVLEDGRKIPSRALTKVGFAKEQQAIAEKGLRQAARARSASVVAADIDDILTNGVKPIDTAPGSGAVVVQEAIPINPNETRSVRKGLQKWAESKDDTFTVEDALLAEGVTAKVIGRISAAVIEQKQVSQAALMLEAASNPNGFRGYMDVIASKVNDPKDYKQIMDATDAMIETALDQEWKAVYIANDRAGRVAAGQTVLPDFVWKKTLLPLAARSNTTPVIGAFGKWLRTSFISDAARDPTTLAWHASQVAANAEANFAMSRFASIATEKMADRMAARRVERQGNSFAVIDNKTGQTLREYDIRSRAVAFAKESALVEEGRETLVYRAARMYRERFDEFDSFVAANKLTPGEADVAKALAHELGDWWDYQLNFVQGLGVNIHEFADDLVDGYFSRMWSAEMRGRILVDEQLRNFIREKMQGAAAGMSNKKVASSGMLGKRKARDIIAEDLEAELRAKFNITDPEFQIFETNPERLVQHGYGAAGRAITAQRRMASGIDQFGIKPDATVAGTAIAAVNDRLAAIRAKVTEKIARLRGAKDEVAGAAKAQAQATETAKLTIEQARATAKQKQQQWRKFAADAKEAYRKKATLENRRAWVEAREKQKFWDKAASEMAADELAAGRMDAKNILQVAKERKKFWQDAVRKHASELRKTDRAAYRAFIREARSKISYWEQAAGEASAKAVRRVQKVRRESTKRQLGTTPKKGIEAWAARMLRNKNLRPDVRKHIEDMAREATREATGDLADIRRGSSARQVDAALDAGNSGVRSARETGNEIQGAARSGAAHERRIDREATSGALQAERKGAAGAAKAKGFAAKQKIRASDDAAKTIRDIERAAAEEIAGVQKKVSAASLKAEREAGKAGIKAERDAGKQKVKAERQIGKAKLTAERTARGLGAGGADARKAVNKARRDPVEAELDFDTAADIIAAEVDPERLSVKSRAKLVLYALKEQGIDLKGESALDLMLKGNAAPPRDWGQLAKLGATKIDFKDAKFLLPDDGILQNADKFPQMFRWALRAWDELMQAQRKSLLSRPTSLGRDVNANVGYGVVVGTDFKNLRGAVTTLEDVTGAKHQKLKSLGVITEVSTADIRMGGKLAESVEKPSAFGKFGEELRQTGQIGIVSRGIGKTLALPARVLGGVAKRVGQKGIAEAAGAVGDVIEKPFKGSAKQIAKVTDSMLVARQKQDNVMRIAHFDTMKAKGLSDEAAAFAVLRDYGNFSEYTKFESRVLKNIFYFYSWKARAIRATAMGFLYRPMMSRAMMALAAGSAREDEDAPHNLRNGAFALGMDGNGIERTLSLGFAGYYSPLSGIAQTHTFEALTGTGNWKNREAGPLSVAGAFMRDIASQMPPPVKGAVEALSDRDMYSGQDLSADPRDPTAQRAGWAPAGMRYLPQGIKDFLGFKEIPNDDGEVSRYEMDPEWRAILSMTIPGFMASASDATGTLDPNTSAGTAILNFLGVTNEKAYVRTKYAVGKRKIGRAIDKVIAEAMKADGLKINDVAGTRIAALDEKSKLGKSVVALAEKRAAEMEPLTSETAAKARLREVIHEVLTQQYPKLAEMIELSEALDETLKLLRGFESKEGVKVPDADKKLSDREESHATALDRLRTTERGESPEEKAKKKAGVEQGLKDDIKRLQGAGSDAGR